MFGRRRWRTRAAAVLAGAALLVGLAACGDDEDSGATSEGGDAEITLNLAYVTTQQHPYGQAVDFFVQEVETASEGRIKITARPSYPQSELQLLADVRSGSVDMATISTAVWDSGDADITSFQALQAPLLITNYPVAAAVLDGPVGTAMREDASEAAGDVTVLAIHEGGLRKPVGGKKPFDTAASFQGAKIRAPQSQVLATGLRALGAEADPLPLPEVYQALQNGTVDGMEANLGLIATSKFYEVAQYVTGNVNLWPFPTALTVNNAKFESLSDADQEIIRAAAAKVPAKSIEIVSASSTLPQQLVDCGVRFVSATPAEITKLQTAAEKAYAELGKDETTKRFIEDIQQVKEDTPPPDAPPPFPTEKSAPDATCPLG